MSKRPVYLDLLRIRQSLTAVVSILHRASGVLLFLLFPVVLDAFARSFTPTGFRELAADPKYKLLALGAGAAFAYHLLAGLRFLFYDTQAACLYRYAGASARIVLLLSAAFVVALGAWLW